MRHRKAFRKFGRTSAHRRSMFQALAMALIENGRIKTTDAKAKSMRRVIEKLITLSKKGEIDQRRQVLSFLGAPGKHRRRDGEPSRVQRSVETLFGDIADRMKDRPGGYTRIVKIGVRKGDAASMSILEFVDYEPEAEA